MGIFAIVKVTGYNAIACPPARDFLSFLYSPARDAVGHAFIFPITLNLRQDGGYLTSHAFAPSARHPRFECTPRSAQARIVIDPHIAFEIVGYGVQPEAGVARPAEGAGKVNSICTIGSNTDRQVELAFATFKWVFRMTAFSGVHSLLPNCPCLQSHDHLPRLSSTGRHCEPSTNRAYLRFLAQLLTQMAH